MNSGGDAGAAWLLADVGGTNVRFALAQPAAAPPLRPETLRAFRVAEFATLADAAAAYLEALGGAMPRPTRAVLAVAGRVEDGQAHLTNHPWHIQARQLEQNLALREVRLVNDFAALGMSLPLLTAQDFECIGPAAVPIRREAGCRVFCVLGPGTGLGVSALAVEGDTVLGLETEGGHVGFAPGNEEEIAILRQLLARFDRVSLERLLCGSGLSNLHLALCAIAGRPRQPLAPEAITAAAQDRSDPYCVRAVELFCELLGSAAGDCVLAHGAWHGVYLAGGLAAPLLPWLRDGRFRSRFEAKGRFAAAMAHVPVALITHPQPGLLGASAFALAAAGRPLLRAMESA
jgi:glucokinase